MRDLRVKTCVSSRVMVGGVLLLVALPLGAQAQEGAPALPADAQPAVEGGEPASAPTSAERPVGIDGLHFGATVSGAWLVGMRYGWPVEAGAVMNWRRSGFDLRASAVLVAMPVLDKGIEGVPLCAGLGGDVQFNGGSRYGFGLGLTAAVGADLTGRTPVGVAGYVSARVAPINLWLGQHRNVELSAFASVAVLPWFMFGFGARLTWVFPSGR